MVEVLGSADPTRKSKSYANLGLRLTFHSTEKKVLVSQAPQGKAIGGRFVSEEPIVPCR